MDAPDKGTSRLTASVVIGAVLLILGASVALFGSVGGMLWSFERIESLPAPTPDDLQAGSNVVRRAMVAGLVIATVGAALFVTGLRGQARQRLVGADEAPWR